MGRSTGLKGAGSEGFVLVAVLWILASLASLALVYAVYVGNTAMAARLYDQRIKAEALITAGIELAAYRLIGYDDSTRPSSGRFTFALGSDQIDVDFQSEGARLDLNQAPDTSLAGLFVALGVKPDAAKSFAEHIVAWRTKVPPGGQNPEAAAYKAAGLAYQPRAAPFQSTAELRLVLGLPPEIVEAALPFVTVFNGRPEIDANEAPPQVLAALPNVTAVMVDEIISQRDPQNPQIVKNLLGTAAANVALGGRKAARVAVHVTFDSRRKVNADVVILIEESGQEPYRVLSWQDDFDGPI
ncbi:MAG TPA: type II secretion system protein GspK [Methylocella sp.]|nr:type II secretion system protein GspK [Methylocella sp.]